MEVGRLGGQLGGLKRTFLQESKIYVIHALWPDAKFSGNVLMTISEKLFGNGFNRSFLHFKGHALGSEALFSGVSDPVPDISDDDIHQAGILMSILKKSTVDKILKAFGCLRTNFFDIRLCSCWVEKLLSRPMTQQTGQFYSWRNPEAKTLILC
ncbi:hypothetical protein AAJCM20276_06450 [Acetobacter aceti]|uniref:Uncharacterized protein n=1 Tax=Acetobacter aceti TaxID=435 RepID=A0A6S6PHD9_ACEAC|nr:hypothetical protein [Acetobacter aceti]BCI66021.1 hypothetical protein AAJCM20276_06450 [Acetobacter aceti]